MKSGVVVWPLVAALATSAHADLAPVSQSDPYRSIHRENGDSFLTNGYVPTTVGDAQTGDAGNGYTGPSGGCGCNSGDRPDAALVVFVAWFPMRRRGTTAQGT